jgi:SAM-dependent methyltransferase
MSDQPAEARKAHWEQIFGTKKSHEMSWHQPRLEMSLALMKLTGVDTDGPIIDVGGGTSTLVDDLLAAGFRDLTVLDIAAPALKRVKERLGEQGGEVHWIEADVGRVALPPERFDVWHDRAVFHFLANKESRERYAATMKSALRPGGHAIIATFGPNAPPQCSGLDVVRYSPEQLLAELSPGLRMIHDSRELHVTPSGKEQEFTYTCFQMIEV